MNFGSFDIVHIIFKTTIVFMVLLILSRALGKKQMSELTFFNYITGITIGSIAANVASEYNEHFAADILGLIWWCILTEVTGYIALKSGTVRRIIDGQPTILIKKGKIIKKALKLTRINMDDLSMLLRNQNAFSIAEVDYAILEPDGSLSVLKKKSLLGITKADMKIHESEINYIPSELIVDGKIIKKNLKELDLSEEWLKKQLKVHNVTSIEEVFYAEIQYDGTLFIDKK